MRLVILFVLLASCGGVTTATGDCADTYSDFGSGFLATNCRSCHQHSSQFGTQTSVQLSANQLSSEINSGRMPQGIAITAADRARVLAWLACGAP